MPTFGLGRAISLSILTALILSSRRDSLYLQPLKFLYDKRLLIGILIFLAGVWALAYGPNPAKAESMGTVKVKAYEWLKDSGGILPDGVPVCYPANIGDICDGDRPVGTVSGAWWQCVELAQRLYYQKSWHDSKS